MIRTTYTSLLHIILFICVLFTNSLYADTNKVLKTDYLELCNIYKNVVNIPVDLAIKEMNLTDNILNKLPTLFNNLFTHIMRSNADKRYELIKQYAKQQNNFIWECEAARLYYIDDF